MWNHFGKTCRGMSADREMLPMTCHFFPDLHMEVERVIPAREMAMVQWRYSGALQNG